MPHPYFPFYLPSDGVIAVLHHVQLFILSCKSKPRSSCLHAVLVSLLVAVIKCYDECNIKEEAFVLLTGLDNIPSWLGSHSGRKLRKQSHYIIAKNRGQRTEAPILMLSLLSYILRNPGT